MEPMTATDVKMLDVAEEEGSLGETLLGSATTLDDGERFITWGETPLSEAQRSLARLLKERLIEIYTMDDLVGLSLEAALDVVADPETWRSHRQHALALVTTDQGEEVLRSEWPRYFDERGRPRAPRQ